VAGALRLLAYLEGQAEDFSQAAGHLDEALALGRSTGDTWSIAATLTSNGLVRFLAGDVQRATCSRRRAAGDVAAARGYFSRAPRIARGRHKVAMTLDIVLGWTATLSQPAEAEKDVALITFAAEQPSAWLETRESAPPF
jgi:hypothetical protein